MFCWFHSAPQSAPPLLYRRHRTVERGISVVWRCSTLTRLSSSVHTAIYSRRLPTRQAAAANTKIFSKSGAQSSRRLKIESGSARLLCRILVCPWRTLAARDVIRWKTWTSIKPHFAPAFLIQSDAARPSVRVRLRRRRILCHAAAQRVTTCTCIAAVKCI